MLAIVASAVILIGQKVLKNPWMFTLAGAFVALAVFTVPFPGVVLGAGLAGWIGGRFAPAKFAVLKSHGETGVEALKAARPSAWRPGKVVLICGALWWSPILAVGAVFGWGSTFFQQGVFF